MLKLRDYHLEAVIDHMMIVYKLKVTFEGCWAARGQHMPPTEKSYKIYTSIGAKPPTGRGMLMASNNPACESPINPTHSELTNHFSHLGL